MKKSKATQLDSILQRIAAARPSEEDAAKLRALERTGKSTEFARALKALDRMEALRGINSLQGVDPKLINPMAIRAATLEEEAAKPYTRAASLGPSLIATLLVEKQLVCDCLVPFTFESLKTFGAMSGPDAYDVRDGLLGAHRLSANEYTVSNPGSLEGKTRVPLNGQIYLTFSAQLPKAGRYCLLMPSGWLCIGGCSRVVGHGNSTTSYDAKVWVKFFMLLTVGDVLLEIAGGEFHYDGTRSEDRDKIFRNDQWLDPRYLFFQANAGDQLVLSFRLEADTAANEDGIAVVVVDLFGFWANSKRSYDTFAIHTG